MLMTPAMAYITANRRRFLAELCDFVRIPSVSAQPEHEAAVRRCAQWLAHHLREIGLERAGIVDTQRHPIVYAEWRHAPGKPTVLIYGHYDVQPVEPLSAWRDPPFAATVRGNTLYGRGASDDKGQIWAHVKALEVYLRLARRLPVNVVCVFEGEEEIGSPNLVPFLERSPAIRAASVALMSDTRFHSPGRPAIIYGLRGSLALEVSVQGPPHDLHAGQFGGAIHNPLQVLCEMIASLHEPHGRITIPGFYDRVRPIDSPERSYLRRTAPPDETILRDARVPHAWGERSYSLYERTTIRPALTINGISGGYTGSGSKSIIPAQVSAKLSFRLVPDQDPREIEHLVRQHLARKTPPTVRSSVHTHSRAKPAQLNPRHPAIRAAAIAYQRGFGAAPVLLRSGGTIPVVNTFESVLGIPTVLMGFALPDDGMHAPNEKFHLTQLWNGIATSISFLHEVGEQRALARSRYRAPAIAPGERP